MARDRSTSESFQEEAPPVFIWSHNGALGYPGGSRHNANCTLAQATKINKKQRKQNDKVTENLICLSYSYFFLASARAQATKTNKKQRKAKNKSSKPKKNNIFLSCSYLV